MHNGQDLIVEIGTEELPPMCLNKMVDVFAKQLKKELTQQGVVSEGIERFATPRRIAVLMHKVTIKTIPQKGSQNFGNSVEQSSHLNYKVVQEIFSAAISKAVLGLPTPKMQWGEQDYVFARPVHWLLVLFGKTVVHIELFGVNSSNVTYGHRYLYKAAITIDSPSEYEEKLLNTGLVVANFTKRKKIIVDLINHKSQEFNAKCMVDAALLEQVTNMVEQPGVLSASFAERFLRLPLECLKSVMGHYQKSFALVDDNNRLIPKFLLVTNMPIADSSNIVRGNEKVMHARLQDAMFLYEQDLQTSTQERLEKLKTVVLQDKLGNLYDHSVQLSILAEKICELLNISDLELVAAKKAALLCKSDLVSKMVLEFPELQGIMGGHYIEEEAKKHNLDEFHDKVANAVKQHYLPKFAEDQLPDNVCDLAVALSYRLNLLCGMFVVGVEASGDQDPFGLRRHAVAIIRMLIEKALPLNIIDLFNQVLSFHQASQSSKTLDRLVSFCIERLKHWYLMQQQDSG